MRLRQLACFVRVCELGSISRAAAELHIAQPALGLQIRSLEHEFATELITRSRRGVSTTAAGEIVLAWARETLDRTKQVRQTLKELEDDQHQPFVTIGMTTSLTVLIAGSIIQALHGSNIKVKIVEGLSQSLAEWVTSHRIDIGLCFGTFEAKGAKAVPVMRERLVYIDAPTGGDGPIRLAEVLDRQLAVPDEQSSIYHTLEAAARSIDMPVIGSYEIGSFQAAREIARRGLAGAIVPFGGVASDLRSGDLSVRMICDPFVERTLYLMRPGDRPSSSAEDSVTVIVAQALREVAEREEFGEAYTILDELRSLSGE